MNIESINVIILLSGVGGILLEMLGFWWLLKYTEIIKYDLYQKWLNKHKYSVIGDYDENPPESTVVYVEMGIKGRHFIELRKLHVEFILFYKRRRSLAITFIIIGLLAQIPQVIPSSLLSSVFTISL